MKENIDQTDKNILAILQTDATISLENIADQIGVSLNTCWRRVQRLEQSGIVQKRVALLDADKMGKGLTVFVSVRTSDHSKAWADLFARSVKNMPEIVEFYRLAGDVDYLLKILAESVSDYDRIYQELISNVALSDVTASFAMEKMKLTTEIPI